MTNTGDTELLDAAVSYASRSWAVFPCRPSDKTPATKHGVKDATTDLAQIRQWWTKSDYNIGIACGAPGPTVLDIDDLASARWVLATLKNSHAPTVATTRGQHLYFRGLDQSTIALGYGELRGHGSYVVAPPSIHPSGKLYTWLDPPNGDLPTVPGTITADRQVAGAGDRPVRESVPHGERHSHLKDLAVRLVRSGITDAPGIERALVAEYIAVCDKKPAAKAGYFAEIAKWAAHTRIAERERERDQRKTPSLTAATATDDSDNDLGKAPGADATLTEHRQYVGAAGGWLPHNDIADIQRFGGKLVDAMAIKLTNGLTIEFRHQGDITARGMWTKSVIAGTNGIAVPKQLKGWQLELVYRSLCILANAPEGQAEAEDHEDTLGDLLTLAEQVLGHHVKDSAAIFALIETLRLRPKWDPRDRNSVVAPALVVDSADSARYLRAGELRDYFTFRNAGITNAEFPGRMSMIGLRQTWLNGREPARLEGVRRTNRALLYRLRDRDPETGAA